MNSTYLLCIYIPPVSYTHLDVYKRQLFRPANRSEATQNGEAEVQKIKNFPGFPGQILRKCPKHTRIPKVF